MIFAKIIGTAWMVMAFFFCIILLIRGVNADKFDFFTGLLSVFAFWMLIGFAPVAVAKFAWSFIR
ncbi:hypothetical protein [Pantoea brenneri]|uniref:hypothetical protein n=1 Tax=Pantoea brenneri TaxID=472694 RepID=UPI00289E59F7|nr:hypothetical protein [Pantoea brenneri]